MRHFVLSPLYQPSLSEKRRGANPARIPVSFCTNPAESYPSVVSKRPGQVQIPPTDTATGNSGAPGVPQPICVRSLGRWETVCRSSCIENGQSPDARDRLESGGSRSADRSKWVSGCRISIF
jgi:hypothetical protein